MATPTELMATFDRAVRGVADYDPRDALWDIIEDILDSLYLACRNYDERQDGTMAINSIHQTVADYVANHYGE